MEKQKDRSGFIYFAKADTKTRAWYHEYPLYKIGQSTNPVERMNGLHYQVVGFPFELLEYAWVFDRYNAEWDLISRFWKYAYDPFDDNFTYNFRTNELFIFNKTMENVVRRLLRKEYEDLGTEPTRFNNLKKKRKRVWL